MPLPLLLLNRPLTTLPKLLLLLLPPAIQLLLVPLPAA
jgi:hypothetical protein